jgi:CIC family chloride channel protein
MISNLIAFFVSHSLQLQTIYEALAQQDDLHLPTGTFRTSSKELRVESAMRPVTDDATAGSADAVADDDALHVHRDHPLSVALQRMSEARCDSLPVVSRQDASIVVGVIRLVDVLAAYGVARELNPTMTTTSDHPPPAASQPQSD